MKKVLVAIALAAAIPASAQTAFTVNGQLVSAAEQKELMNLLAEQGIKDEGKQAEAARNILVREKVIGQEARKLKLQQTPEIKTLLAERETQILANELVRRNAAAHPVTDKQIQDAYADMKKQYSPNEIKVRHILVKSEDEAKSLISQIKNGADMGEIPFTNIRSIIIPGFAETAMGMNKGDVLPIPFHSSLGYHVIKLEDKREVPFPELDKIKDQVEGVVARQNAANYLSNLVKNAKVADVQSAQKPAPKKTK
ncbi:peptidyl-prolyl cis-trans isomerase [uncultured Parasutterella sp.]|uniref:peptidylprolyl isomerase n=1 Tax=uncultured Parasutterella sp. TaxID=1263098 RepID=UPI002594BF9F|nr:peptidyl-prolyl cis-trans isomerase [uncultured Parasutterella sp.]